MVQKAKVKKTLNILLKLLIVVAAYGFLYYQLFRKDKLDQVLDALNRFADIPGLYFMLAIVVMMMFLNWSIEAFKWRYLLKDEEQIGFLKSLKAVFAGITVSIFTPNRVGVFLGRVFILKKAKPLRAVFITIIGSYSQLLVTLITGYIAVLYFSAQYLQHFEAIPVWLFTATAFGVGLVILLLTLLYLNLSILDPLVNRLINSRWKKIGQYFSVFSRFNTSTLLKVFGFSLLRYGVFTLQFLLLIHLFQVPVPWFDGFMLIALMFFTMSAIPTVTLAELGVRGSVTITLFRLYLQLNHEFTPMMEFGVFSASSALWLINLALPALLGTLFIFQLRFFKKNSAL